MNPKIIRIYPISNKLQAGFNNLHSPSTGETLST
jgi:hypothetical protein